MPINRSHFKTPFRYFPAWRCPTCGNGTLVKQEEGFTLKETGPSASAHGHDAWDPDWIVQRFSGLLKCNHPHCGELSAISGNASVDYDYDIDENGEYEQTYETFYTPKSIVPPPNLFIIPTQCPTEVTEPLEVAFALIWSDLDSTANKFRVAAELLLNDQKIPKFSVAKAGKKRAPLHLHARIERFKLKNPDVAEYMMAIKWLGNHASHSASNMALEDVLIAGELFEHVLKELYIPKADILKKAKHINKKKGPIKKKTK